MALRLPTVGRFKQVNACGGCTACCTEIGVKELGKPPRCRCQHQTETGCGIYGQHPGECQRYACAWALGAFGSNDNYRPDKCGLLLTLNTAGNQSSIGVFVLRPDADRERMIYLLGRLREKYPGYPITLVHPQGVQVGASFECKAPYPVDLSNRPNVFTVHVKDPNMRVCQGPAELPKQT
jgi:hypothetical protein